MPKLIRNRVTERDIRQWLDENGYHGGSAKLDGIELHAIKRPGWKQLFRFSGSVRLQESDSEKMPERSFVWGIVLDDERKPVGKQTEVFLFDSESGQAEQLSILSADMLTANNSSERAFGVWSLFGIALFFAAMLFLIAMVKKQYE